MAKPVTVYRPSGRGELTAHADMKSVPSLTYR